MVDELNVSTMECETTYALNLCSMALGYTLWEKPYPKHKPTYLACEPKNIAKDGNIIESNAPVSGQKTLRHTYKNK